MSFLPELSGLRTCNDDGNIVKLSSLGFLALLDGQQEVFDGQERASDVIPIHLVWNEQTFRRGSIALQEALTLSHSSVSISHMGG